MQSHSARHYLCPTCSAPLTEQIEHDTLDGRPIVTVAVSCDCGESYETDAGTDSRAVLARVRHAHYLLVGLACRYLDSGDESCACADCREYAAEMAVAS